MSMTVEEAIAIIEDVTWKDFGRHYGKVPIAREMAILALEEVQKYIAIGTVSEFRELKEKATAKPVYRERGFDKCPNCGEVLNDDYGEQYKFCPDCGQQLLWT